MATPHPALLRAPEPLASRARSRRAATHPTPHPTTHTTKLPLADRTNKHALGGRAGKSTCSPVTPPLVTARERALL